MTLAPDTAELVALYRDEGCPLDVHVIAAFVEAGEAPPDNHAALRGFDSRQSKILSAYYQKRDPYGARATTTEEA